MKNIDRAYTPPKTAQDASRHDDEDHGEYLLTFLLFALLGGAWGLFMGWLWWG